MFQVLDNDRPADASFYGYSDSHQSSRFETFEEARSYLDKMARYVCLYFS